MLALVTSLLLLQAPVSLWPDSARPVHPADPDANPVTLGVRFQSSVPGQVTGVRFYKGAGNAGPHTGGLWTASGTLLAQGQFAAETASGWQSLTFGRPVTIQANTDYVAGYLAPRGHYACDESSFGSPIKAGPLTASAGLYAYSSSLARPTGTYRGSNYWVDVVFLPASSPTPTPTPPPTPTPIPTPTPTPIPTPTPPAITGTSYTITPTGDLMGALAKLQPGDALVFQAGDYHVKGTSGGDSWMTQLLGPKVSGTASRPITLMAAAGATVRVIEDSGDQPVFGTTTPNLSYIRFLGFIVVPGHDAFHLSGTGNEVGWCEVQGSYWQTTDNHDGIRLEHATATWIHGCDVHGVKGDSLNSNGLKVYTSQDGVVEDNYFHDCTIPIYDKDSGKRNNYRRNWIVNVNDTAFLCNTQGNLATYAIYDNVFDGKLDFNLLGTGHQVYNNLIRMQGSPYSGNIDAVSGQRQLDHLQLWNNVYQCGAKPTWGLRTYTDWTAGTTVSVMDYNIYDGAPSYRFNATIWDLAHFQGQGFETHARVASGIYAADLTLTPAFAAAGKDGGPVGPRVPVAELVRPTRYGPGGRP